MDQLYGPCSTLNTMTIANTKHQVMTGTKPSRVIHNVFSQQELQVLQEWFDNKPVSAIEPTGIQNKNLDYHVETSAAFQVIKPKVNSLIGSDHEFATGSYKECPQPYQIHIDHYAFQQKNHSFSNKQKHELALLIPLSQGPEFKTIMFDIFDIRDLFFQSFENGTGFFKFLYAQRYLKTD